MKNSEIIYFDVDGTILDGVVQKISEKTIESLEGLHKAGYKVAIATGRTSGALNSPAIASVFDWDAYVLANGGSIMDKEMNILKEHLCEPEFVHSVIKEYPGTIILEGYNNYVMNEMSPAMRDFLGESANALEVLKAYNDEPVHKIIVEDIDLIKDGYNNPIFKNYDYFINTAGMPEIYPKNSGKSIGVRELNEILDIERHTYFGDGNNDIDPIRDADFGVAMENGTPAAKEVADYITKSAADDGVYYALKHFELI